MALQKFVFRVGSEVAGMKIAFCAIFESTLTHILAPRQKLLYIYMAFITEGFFEVAIESWPE